MLSTVAMLVMVHPPPGVVVPVAHHARVRVVVDVVSRVHPGVQLLLNLPHILSTSGVKGSDVGVLSLTVTYLQTTELS